MAFGFNNFRKAFVYLGIVFGWSVSLRFGYGFLIANPFLLRSLVVLTIGVAVNALVEAWRIPAPVVIENAVPVHA